MSITDYIHGSIGEVEFVVLVDKERLTEADQREAPYWIDVKNGNEDEYLRSGSDRRDTGGGCEFADGKRIDGAIQCL